MTQQEQNVVEAARRVIRKYPPEIGCYWGVELNAEMTTLALAVRALDLAARETWRGEQREAD